MSSDPHGPRRRGPLGLPLLGWIGVALGVAVLALGVILLTGDDEPGIAATQSLAGLPAFPIGDIPAAAPDPAARPDAFAVWAQQRADADWEGAFAQAGRPWERPPAREPAATDPAANDPSAYLVLGAGTRAAAHVMDLLGVPERIARAGRERPESRAQVQRQGRQMAACLAGAWGRTLLTPARLAAAAPATEAESVRTGAESGDPAVCDTLSVGGAG